MPRLFMKNCGMKIVGTVILKFGSVARGDGENAGRKTIGVESNDRNCLIINKYCMKKERTGACVEINVE